jgi:hypothetical protein
MAEHANHADNLATVQRGMYEHVPQDFPARKAPLHSSRQL